MSTGKGNAVRRDDPQPAGNVHTCHETTAERCPRCDAIAAVLG